ncbi:hypothetical protein GHT06_013771 [Daphnia sinensis]|uniref:ETFB lysine methyltransferase n=1 Tax=Daphnia sinensis TaxID=1820382 RepID=A0AAD5LBR2_9CRUS|nr:hypothetical protein GHT06_013771 [Daphnia sinensis]
MNLLKPLPLRFYRGGVMLSERNVSQRSHSYSNYRELIESYTAISDKHLTPEIKLRLITRECQAWYEPVENNSQHPLGEPFWAFYWPGGQALSRYILDNPSVTRGKCVLDFGSGSGALSIAALKSGAKSAVANDIDHMAIAASQLNAQINAVELKFSEDNLIGTECLDYDLILVGDMLYDTTLSNSIATWLLNLRSANKTVLVGDPGRGPVGTSSLLSQLCRLAKYELDSVTKKDNYGFHQAHVFTLL